MSEANENLSPAPDLSGVLSSLLSNPGALSKLSGILSKFTAETDGNNSPLDSNLTKDINTRDALDDKNQTDKDDLLPTEAASSNPDTSLDFSKIASIFSSINLPKTSKNNKEIALLLAIKPYLSPRRKDLIDSFIQITNFSEIFKSINHKGGSDVL